MATGSSEQKVQKLDTIPLKTKKMTHPIRISNHEFVIATAEPTQKLLIYNASTKLWRELFDYSNWRSIATKYKDCTIPSFPNEFGYPALAYDPATNKYYIVSDEVLLLEIDINSKSMTLYENPIKETGINPSAVYVNDQLHIIGGYDSNRHIIFDTKTKEWIEHFTFKELATGLSSPALVYIKSKNMLYLMGGYSDEPDSSDSEYQENENNDGLNGHLDIIRGYSIKDKLWNDLSLKLPTQDGKFPYFVTTDEQYVVVVLTYNYQSESETDDNDEYAFRIYYLNLEIEPFEFMESPFIPKFDIAHAVMTGSNTESTLIVYGYFRLLELNDKIIIPQDLMDLIVSFYDVEYVHFFEDVWDDDIIFRLRYDHCVVK